MNLVVRKPGYRPARANSFDHLFDSFFNRNLGDFFGNDVLKDSPSVNIIEKDDAFEIELAAPGLDKADFNVKVEDNTLLISAKKETKNEEEGENGKFVRREFSFTSFERSFRLPENVNGENIKANYVNGVLVINLPKTEVVETARTIEIH